MVVEGGSKTAGNYIVQNSNLADPSALWSFLPLHIETPIETGYYGFKNLNSGKDLSVLNKSPESGAYIVQHSFDNSDSQVWHVVKQPEGTYTIRNISSNKYLSVEHDSFAEHEYINQQLKVEGASQKWIIVKEGDKYLLKNYASGQYLHVYFDLKDEDEYLLQSSTPKISSYWNILPITYDVPIQTGGVFNIKNPHTGYYLSVQNGGTTSGDYLIDTETGTGKESWWTLELYENGAYLIKNVKSQMYMTVKDWSEVEDAYIIQTPSDGTAYGSALWRLMCEPDIPNFYWIRSVFSGKVIYTLYGSTKPNSYITQHTVTGGDPTLYDKNFRWQFIPVNRTEITKSESAKATDKISNNQTQPNKIELTQSNNIFNIHSTTEKIKNIDVISIDGRIIKKQKINSNDTEMDLSSLAAGVYILNIDLDNNSHESKKIMIY